MKRQKRNQQLGRRQFIKGAAAGIVAAPSLVSCTALGTPERAPANGRIGIGVIGLGGEWGRGRYVMRSFMGQPDTQVVAVCDVKRENREGGRDQVNKEYGNQDCDAYIDFLEMLERPDIDAVLIATGENWHSGISILAAEAGKDIYCEKPMGVAINESRAVAETMRRLGRVFQCGTQRRSLDNFRYAVDLARSGKLGQLTELHAEELATSMSMYDTGLPAEPEPPREELDWDRWLGPAKWRDYNSKYLDRYGYYFRHWDFGGGSITEWGNHSIDQCQWANDTEDTGPVEYWREGDRFIGRYANGVKLVIRKGFRTGPCSVRFEGDEGWVETGDSGEIFTHPKSLFGEQKFKGIEVNLPNNHVRAFLDSVKSREETIANADVAHRSVSPCHLANLCKRLDRPIKWDPLKEECIDDEEANRLCSREYRGPWHL